MLGRLLGGGREERIVQDPAWTSWAQGGSLTLGGNTAAGKAVTADTATTLLTVYACVAFLADTISTMPLHAYRSSADGMISELTDPVWLVQPNKETDLVTFVSQLVTSLALDGNAFVVPVRNATGRVVELWPLDPGRVQVERASNGDRVYKIDNQTWAGELLHVPLVTRAGALRGLSPIEAARQVVGMGMAMTEFNAAYFANGATMTGVIEVPGRLEDDAAKRMRDSFARHHSGSAKAHLPGVLTGGASWKPITVNHEQMQFLDSRQYTDAQISGQLFRIDPSFLGIPMSGNSSLTYANLESRGIHLVRFTLLPYLVRIERMLSALLARPQYVKFNVDGLMRGATGDRYNAYSTALTAGFLTVDEVRELEDLPPLPEEAEPADTEPADPTVDDTPSEMDPEQQMNAAPAPAVNVRTDSPRIHVEAPTQVVYVEPKPIERIYDTDPETGQVRSYVERFEDGKKRVKRLIRNEAGNIIGETTEVEF